VDLPASPSARGKAVHVTNVYFVWATFGGRLYMGDFVWAILYGRFCMGDFW
jgi:hypothetical protein